MRFWLNVKSGISAVSTKFLTHALIPTPKFSMWSLQKCQQCQPNLWIVVWLVLRCSSWIFCLQQDTALCWKRNTQKDWKRLGSWRPKDIPRGWKLKNLFRHRRSLSQNLGLVVVQFYRILRIQPFLWFICRSLYYGVISFTHPILNFFQGTKEIEEGQTAHFEAQIEPLHDPNLRVEVNHNGKPLGSASRFHITFDFGYFALDIGHCVAGDAGEYSVKAINKLGSCVSSTSMKVVGEYWVYI